MANVLIGIVGVVLFIGLALAGASFFGPVMGDAMVEARANGLIQVLSTTSKAVSVRNRELETITPGSSDSSILVPDYLEDLPTSPVNGNSVMMLNELGQVSGGMTTVVASKLAVSDLEMCGYINRQGGGSGTVPTINSNPSQSMGCARSGVNRGPLVAGDLYAYITIN